MRGRARATTRERFGQVSEAMPDVIGGVERKPGPPAVSFQPLPRNELTSAPVKGAAPTAQMAGPTTTEQCRYHQPIGDFVERRAACSLPLPQSFAATHETRGGEVCLGLIRHDSTTLTGCCGPNRFVDNRWQQQKPPPLQTQHSFGGTLRWDVTLRRSFLSEPSSCP